MTERHDEFAADNAVNTAAKPKILSAKKCFEGAIFSVEERQISLPGSSPVRTENEAALSGRSRSPVRRRTGMEILMSPLVELAKEL